MLSLFIGAWLSISPLQFQSDTTSVILVEWWHTINKNAAFNKNNYTVTDSVNNYKVYSIFKVDSVQDGGGWAVPKNTYLFGLVTEKISYNKFIYVITKDYGYASFYHRGFVPNVIKAPQVNIKY